MRRRDGDGDRRRRYRRAGAIPILDQVLASRQPKRRACVAWATVGNQPIYVMRGICSSPTSHASDRRRRRWCADDGTRIAATRAVSGVALPLREYRPYPKSSAPWLGLVWRRCLRRVINIITKTAMILAARSYARVGAFASKDAWVQHGGNISALAAFCAGGKTDGQKETIERDAQATRDNNPPFLLTPVMRPVHK